MGRLGSYISQAAPPRNVFPRMPIQWGPSGSPCYQPIADGLQPREELQYIACPPLLPPSVCSPAAIHQSGLRGPLGKRGSGGVSFTSA